MKSDRVIVVIGSGAMGACLAQAAAQAGFQVEMFDIAPDRAREAQAEIARRFEMLAAKGELSSVESRAAAARVRAISSLDDLRHAECIIEAVSEDLALKREVLRKAEAAASPRSLLATSTTTLLLAAIADAVKHGERFVGMHLVRAEPSLRIVELVRAPATSDQTMVSARAICTRTGKSAVVVRDSAGFIGHRVHRQWLLAAMALADRGEADIGTIDRVVREVGGFANGPIEWLDEFGLDADLVLAERLYAGLGKPARLAPGAVQRRLVESGHLGRKTGRGFYHYGDGQPVPAFETPGRSGEAWRPTPVLQEFAAGLQLPADRSSWILARIAAAVVSEAAIVGASIAAPRDVDSVMRLGFGYPDGPLALADRIGLDVMQRLLLAFHQETDGDERYKASPLLDRHVRDGNLGEKTARGFLHHSL